MFSKPKFATTLSALFLLKQAQSVLLTTEDSDCGNSCGGNKADINLVFKVNVGELKDAILNGTDPSSAITAV